MTTQVENAIARYRRNLEKELRAASDEVRSAATQDADEFLMDEAQAMDVGRLTSEDAAYDRFVERFGTPKQLAKNYSEQDEVVMPMAALAEDAVDAQSSGWKKFAAVSLLAMVATGGICYAAFSEPPKLSPFTDVKFHDEKLLVTYEGHEYEWLELDDFTVKEIVSSSKNQFGDLWQKRVAEDLVEVLWGMDHRPSETVRLRLVDPRTKVEKMIPAAPMTKENRRSLYGKRMDALIAGSPPKISPFTDVNFDGDQVVVTYEGHDYQWLGLDHLSVDEIVASSKQQFGYLWQKRVAEDLVEVLWGMGHRPSDTVRLRLKDRVTKEEQVTAAAAMTKENRRSLYQKHTDAARANVAEPLGTP